MQKGKWRKAHRYDRCMMSLEGKLPAQGRSPGLKCSDSTRGSLHTWLNKVDSIYKQQAIVAISEMGGFRCLIC